jgi:carbon storage regulator CsrA
MLVLCRKRNESVVLGDEVTVTVEEICGGDGQRIFGAALQLGFQSPPYVSIYRSELRAKGSGGSHAGGTARPAPPRPGRRVEISDAVVRLRIHLPRKIPVCCNGTPTAGVDAEERPDDDAHTSTAEHHVTCHKEDRITICNNITVAILKFHRFVSPENP